MDHKVSAKLIIDMKGFDRLTPKQMSDILQDNIGVGNLQALPKSINGSKGKFMGDEFKTYKGETTNSDYRASLLKQQNMIEAKIQKQIKLYQKVNAGRT